MSRKKKGPGAAIAQGTTTVDTKKEDTFMNGTADNNGNYVIAPAKAPKQVLAVPTGGAGRGARENQQFLADFNRESERVAFSPVYIDPVPGRAVATKEAAALRGLAADAIEGRVEDVISGAGDPKTPLMLAVDRASAVASALEAVDANPRPVLGYLLLKVPSGWMWGVRFVLEAHDTAGRRAAIALFRQLAEISERNRSGDILGESGDPEDALVEPTIRRWFGEHANANLPKLVAGLEPESAPFEVTMDGRTTQTLHIVEHLKWADPAALADEVLGSLTTPIRRGTEFIVAEVTPGAVRFHTVRRRTDNRVTVGGAEVVDRASVEARRHELELAKSEALVRAEMEELRQRAIEALARAERQTLSRLNPIWTTD